LAIKPLAVLAGCKLPMLPDGHSALKSQAFQTAELRSECIRITVLLTVFGSLLGLVAIRGVIYVAHGYHGTAWPFALILAVMTAYELVWLRSVRRAIHLGREVSRATWTANILVESLLPTTALFLQIHTSLTGPRWTLTSPAVLAYFLLIILSTLHLDPGLSRLAGGFSAAGYAVVSLYVLVRFPEVAADHNLLVYGTCLTYAACLLIGGFTAGAVAGQIRRHVLAALDEAESRAKIEHDLDLARSIQQGLLPKTPPGIAGFDIAGWNQPADQTGGDYFDWQQLTDGRLALTIADVTGHGIASALGMTGCRAYARAALATDADLRSLIAHLNGLLYEDLPTEKFVTLAAGVLDPEKATLHLISAGHGPLLFYSAAEDRFRTYDAQGPPLGLLPGFSYCDAQLLRFAPGDMLVLVTDGLVEWANVDDEDFGEKRLKEAIRAHRDLPAAAIISGVYAAVRKFAGSTPQLDDLTALVVKRVGAPIRAPTDSENNH
jgi:serine phosphatase RsbU (regulator of sigma subunit)